MRAAATVALLCVGLRATPAAAVGQVTVLAGGLGAPYDLAIDGKGNLFVCYYQGGKVLELPAGGGHPLSVGHDLSFPRGLAVDTAGDLFIADSGNNRVVEVPEGGGAQIALGRDLLAPDGVAVDGKGNVFIADTGNNRVVEVPAAGGPELLIAYGLTSPQGLAIYPSGERSDELFIADTGNGRVVSVITYAAGSFLIPAANTLSAPAAVALAAGDHVFIADTGNNRVLEVPAIGGPAVTLPIPGLRSPGGVAADGQGNLFVADTGNRRVLKIAHVFDPPRLRIPVAPTARAGTRTTFLIAGLRGSIPVTTFTARILANRGAKVDGSLVVGGVLISAGPVIAGAGGRVSLTFVVPDSVAPPTGLATLRVGSIFEEAETNLTITFRYART